ncbi:MAG: class I SAM-dependent methyltransferase [Minisyncoccia bacterium]|jgi:hypothetical protein
MTPPKNRGASSGNFEFGALAEAKNYRRALVRRMSPHLRGKVAEIGAGIGQMTGELLLLPGVTRLECVEPDPAFCREFKKAFPQAFLVEGTVKDIATKDWDGVVSINVLEHIEDDEGELSAYRGLLGEKHGVLALFVPARKELYAPIDRDFGHYRRYDKRELETKLDRAGFKVRLACHYDFVGYFAWWLNFRLIKKRSFDPAAVRAFDRLVFPWADWIESRLSRPPIGKNLFVIAEAL